MASTLKNKEKGRGTTSPVTPGTPILVHICCGPCGTASIERLLQLGYSVTLYYSNSNIYPEEEFYKRAESAKRTAEYFQAPIYIDAWDHASWREAVKGFEQEPEGGKRCERCFAFSLERTEEKAAELNIPYFTTTLTISPYKNSQLIHEIGSRSEGFVPENFKKFDGYRRSVEMSRKLELYRQEYCGCEFSLAEMKQKRRRSN